MWLGAERGSEYGIAMARVSQGHACKSVCWLKPHAAYHCLFPIGPTYCCLSAFPYSPAVWAPHMSKYATCVYKLKCESRHRYTLLTPHSTGSLTLSSLCVLSGGHVRLCVLPVCGSDSAKLCLIHIHIHALQDAGTNSHIITHTSTSHPFIWN